MKYDVFVSYSSKDEKVTMSLCDGLEREGFSYFRDHAQGGIAPSEDFLTKLSNTLHQCSALIVMLSPNSEASGWVSKEVVEAINRHIPIFPIKIGELNERSGLQLAVNTIQWIDATSMEMDEVVGKLAQPLRVIAHKEAMPAAQSGAPMSDLSTLAKQHALIGIKLFEVEDYEDAIPELRKAANMDDPDAQYYFGQCHFNGIAGMQKDEKKGNEWFLRAAQQGNAQAQNAIGVSYFMGRGVEPDEQAAAAWFEKAAAQGQRYAMRNLGFIAEEHKDMHRAVEWYRQAAEKGEADSMYRLGEYYNGIGNDEQARAYYEQAAQLKHGDAESRIGRYCALEGKIEEAFEWFCKGMKDGSLAAQYNIGVLYVKGAGVEKDVERGLAMMHDAIVRGHEDGREKMKKCFDGLSIFERQKYRRYLDFPDGKGAKKR